MRLPPIRSRSSLYTFALLCGCAVAAGTQDDAGPVDASQTLSDRRIFPDSRPVTDGAPQPDGQRLVDASPRPDARPRPDAAPPIDAALPPDAAIDAAPPPDANPNELLYQSASTGTATTKGLNISSNIWVGWRFEVTETTDVDTLGFYGGGSTGSIFGALVTLDGPDDVPDDVTLNGADVLIAPVVVTVSNSPGHVEIPVSETVSPGWYAVVFGTGSFGASLGANLLVTRGHNPIAGAQGPITLIQSTKTINQSTIDDMRLYVRGLRP